MELTDLSVKELGEGYRAKTFSVVDVAKAHLVRIEKENPTLNAYLEVFDDVVAEAERAEKILTEKGAGAHLLTGIPIAVKDNILIKGKKVSAASKMLENYVATYDATAIARLKNAGAFFLGRTNMDEFAMGSSTEHSAYGVTKNPHDITRVPGGSSGGSASAVAAHLAPIALGSETCGSIRQPVSLCGLVGLKPTYGEVSRSGLIAMGSSLDQIGPIARTVYDAKLVFETIRGSDSLDGTTLPNQGETRVSNKRIGVPREFVKDAQPDVRENFEKTLDTLRGKGYEIVDIEFPSAPYGLAAYYIVMPAEVSTNLARLDGIRYGLSHEGKNLLDEYEQSRARGFGAETKRRVMLGAYVLSSGYYDAYYKRATALRSVIANDLAKAFENVSFIATPTTPGPAFKIGEKSDPVSMYLEDIFAAPANLTGIPAISVPMNMVVRDGVSLPVGVQFMSPKRTESSLFDIARDLIGETL
ncbi:MAG: Asp-tRNA(Asn)/Glu-tRNA(Gln) amidotransferase subunit GatA [Candidatus Pacebacteria bacterium]|nr:Asp-tRNA(Asn)/Glu-tRNA(Gln) amidotransferase subunit GatA [Candidatus Paceibacterota bacterium]MBP9832221.1 Asp-tRNA(Asn)/Glu-tRNA(Gln) amidotransferase subunit GatA [Candidatus Paceibacterota bacterium]